MRRFPRLWQKYYSDAFKRVAVSESFRKQCGRRGEKAENAIFTVGNGKKDEAAVEYERQSAKLIKELEKKDSEIVRLKDYIRSQEEFLPLQSKTEPDEAAAVNMDILQAKKYLFVGDAKEALPDLRKKFAGSILMQSETTDISNISVDAIVFLTKWMSHAIYYKVKKSSIYQKVPSAMCNTKNIDRILFDMERQLGWD